MSSNNYQQPNFWDFVNSFDLNRTHGQGVDHNDPPSYAGFFPFGGPGHRGSHPPPPPPPGAFPWGGPDGHDSDEWNPWAQRGGPWGRRGWRHGHRGHHHGHERDQAAHENPTAATDNDHRDGESPETMRDDTNVPDPAEVSPEDNDDHRPRSHGHGRGRGGFGRCGRGRGSPHGHRHGHHHPGGPGPHHAGPHHRGPGGPPPYPGGFDFPGFMRTVGSHPIFQNLRDFIPNPDGTRNNNNNTTDPEAFSPPVDTFDTPTAYVLHVALPGARKEDVGVTWDADARRVRIAGVVHRPGDEAFLATLRGSGERRVGLFERYVDLEGEDEEVDGMNISAKMEDGILVVNVPKLPKEEKEWTEIHKVDVE